MSAGQRLSAGQLAQMSDEEISALLVTACDGEPEKLDQLRANIDAEQPIDTSAAASVPFWSDCED